ncbi:DNA/RNA nuclease SfsA [Desulfotomaculum sp. 1211_IL3151]|uniref:DNA/RNA nuclease SfsA n=1 Tax=Desulfotomaculum sp. 1211_IL3151 TaxID=3084055 RepID=UPI002FDAE478
MISSEKPIEGIFIKERKNRFICEVMVEDEAIECYVPSSCRLDNFIDLHGKRVLLLPTEAPSARTKFSLFAVPYKRNHIFLNIGKVNSVIERDIKKRCFSTLGKRSEIYREYKIGSYKSDLFIANSSTLLEVKSILSLRKGAVFPTVFSQRTLKQLKEISSLMDRGYNAALVIASLSPYVEQIQIDRVSPFYEVLMPCIEKGMQLLAVSLHIIQGEARIKRKIKIEW